MVKKEEKQAKNKRKGPDSSRDWNPISSPAINQYTTLLLLVLSKKMCYYSNRTTLVVDSS
jgi:hypothetical protein